MGYIAVSTRVYARSSLGRFIADCEGAGTATVRELVSDGADLSRDLSPKETGELAASIGWVMLSATSGQWYATARHALPQEFGASAHIIRGNPSLSFFWEKEGRMWIPAEAFYNEPGRVDEVHHPGNPPHPYLRPAYATIMATAIQVADRHYPG